MAVITATSDFGLKDPNVALAKAQFIRRVKELQWVDISHEVEPHNVLQAAFLLKRSLRHFHRGVSTSCMWAARHGRAWNTFA